MRIALADDHSVVLEGLRAVLAAESDFELVGEVSEGHEVTPLCERLHPDVLVLDLMMPKMNGLDVLTEIARRAPETRVVVLTMHAHEAYVAQAIQNGATGYVLKSSSSRELVAAIRKAAAGERYLSSAISEEALASYREKAQSAPGDPLTTLTGREREVLTLAAQGKTNAEIAETLGIGRRTVESHRESLMRKLGLRSLAELIHFAIRRGIIEQ
jgi:DNA-binding NarL/FixJ family response regulator